MPQPPVRPASTAVQGADTSDPGFLELIACLRRRWMTVAWVVFVGTGAAVAYALLATPIYRATAVIAPSEAKQTTGASAALAAFGGIGAEIAGSLGISLGGGDVNRLEALLKSHRLIARTVEKHDLLRVFFDETWDPETKSWTVDAPEDAPNVWDAQEFLDGVYKLNNDTRLGVLRLSLEFKDPQAARRILRLFLDEMALLMQEDELQRIAANRIFAEKQLQTATDPVIVAKLQALLSDQVEQAMMAQNLEQVAFQVLDPPSVSDKRVKPERKIIAGLGGGLSLFAGMLLALTREWLDNVKRRRSTAGAPAA